MSNVVDFLGTLGDQELAFFLKYRKGSYMPSTEASIEEYVKGRGMSSFAVEMLTTGNTAANEGSCPRCGSAKRFENDVPIWNTGQYSGIGNQLSSRQPVGIQAECAVCGYSLSDPNNADSQEVRAEGILAWIRWMFGG